MKEWETRESIGLPWRRVSENCERDGWFEGDAESGEERGLDGVCFLLWERRNKIDVCCVLGSQRIHGGHLAVYGGSVPDLYQYKLFFFLREQYKC